MMELSHSLTLNEDALAQIAEAKRPVFVFEWLRFLDKVLVAAQKSDIKGCQKKLVEQLTDQINKSPGPPTRKLIGRCMATVFTVGDTFLLFETVNRCNEIVKNKDDSPSYLATKVAAITCIGAMYERLGRMMGRSYEETVQILIRCLRNAESQVRCEIMFAMERICIGMESAINSVVKEMYKAARHCLTDRTMAVRCAAAKCLLQMLKHTATFLYTTELESFSSLCFRAFDGSNYDVRCMVGKLLGTVMAATQEPPRAMGAGKMRTVSLDEALVIMMTGFLRGGIGFLKGGAGEMIKGTSGVSREIRIGVTHAYVTFVQTLGPIWLERYQTTIVVHVLDLVSNPKAATTHVDAVYSRKCISFILRSVLGRMLSEKAQVAACKDLCQIILRLVNSGGCKGELPRSFHSLQRAGAATTTIRELCQLCIEDSILDAGASPDQLYSQHGLVCALQELGCVIQTLGTTASSLVSEPGANVVDTVASVLLHPAPAARLAAAWCLRSISIAFSSQLTPLVDRCTERLESLKTSPEAIGGYSAALAALVGATRCCPLGMPHARGKVLFNMAEDLLRTAAQNSRLSMPRTQAGWLLISSIMTLGPPVVRGLLPRMLLLWRISFPRSSKELESEKARGDAFTWQVTLEGRAGALSSIHSFLANCFDLVTPEVVRRLLAPIDSALAMLSGISGVIKSYGQHLKASAAMLRLRLYEVLSLLPTQSYDSSYSGLLRLLVAEFTLTENPANTTTSQLRTVCHADDSVILGSWLQETDHKSIEDQMEPNRKLDKENLQPNSSSGSGALEHDPSALYKTLPHGEVTPGPLPLGVAVIDMSVSLFGLIFPRVPYKHRLQMLEHFAECIRQSKSVRQEAIQINVFTAVLNGMKGLSEAKTSFGQDDVRKAAVTLVIGALTHSNPILRCAAGEALGRMTQVIGDSRFVAEVTQHSFERLKSARDVVSRTGHSLALGCVHRYVGGMGSSQHLNTSVSILLALSQDTTSPIVQAWALHALALIADSGGPMFRAYVEPTLSLSLRLLLNVPMAHVDVIQCVGKLLAALITTIGPELHGNTNSICMARSSFLCTCAIMQEHHDPLVQAEATGCLQQLHMFAPRHVNLSSLVPTLCKTLGSTHLLLRRAAVACLRQLAQREAREVCEHARTLMSTSPLSAYDQKGLLVSRDAGGDGRPLVFSDTGLPGVLFSMLDTETDRQLVSDIHDTVNSMLQALAEDNLTQWLGLCKEVLTSSLEASGSPVVAVKDADGLDVEVDVSDESRINDREDAATHLAIVPRWPTRVFAAECACRIIATCRSHRAHYDLALARDLHSGGGGSGDYLVLHLSDLVRMAFMAATSDSDQLRLEGLRMLQLIIDNFAKVPEPEFPGHVILEQYQAQVCSTWIGSEVARDLNDLRRVHQLLVSSLTKLQKGASSMQLYNESTATLEKLAILKAWAEVYVVAMQQNEVQMKGEAQGGDQESPSSPGVDEDPGHASLSPRESLLDLVSPELPSLSQNWLDALRDHAILSLTPELAGQQRQENGAFYSVGTMESARVHYRNSWAPILNAAANWLNHDGFRGMMKHDASVASGGRRPSEERVIAPPSSATARDGVTFTTDEVDSDRFHLIFGICMEALCSPKSSEPLESVLTCLTALRKLLDSSWARSNVGDDPQLAIELCNVLHRLLLTRENPTVQLRVMDVVKQVVMAASEALLAQKKRKLKELAPANQEPKSPDETAVLGEGGSRGEIIPGKSTVFAILEVCLCVLVRHLPSLNPSVPKGTQSSAPVAVALHSKLPMLTKEGAALVSAALNVMAEVPALCSCAGSVAVLPTILFLETGVLREVATSRLWSAAEDRASVEPLASVLHCFRQLVSCPLARDSRCKAEWTAMLQSALAKIVDLSKTSAPLHVDEVCVLLTVAVFVICAPLAVVIVPNILSPCIELFTRTFESDTIQVRIKVVQVLQSVFHHPNRSVAIPFIHALAGRIIEQLNGNDVKQPLSDEQMNLTLECISAVDVMVYLAEPQNRIHILTLAIPIFVKLLSDSPQLVSMATRARAIHDDVLRRLMKIGPQFPQDFCTVMTLAPQLKAKLESAVRANQSAVEQSTPAANNGNHERASEESSRMPSIKLKTDFSNFTV